MPAFVQMMMAYDSALCDEAPLSVQMTMASDLL